MDQDREIIMTRLIIDAHCDTMTKLMIENTDLNNNSGHLIIDDCISYGTYIQIFAIFIEQIFNPTGALKYALKGVDKFYQQIEKFNQSTQFIKDYKDIENLEGTNRLGCLLSIEGGEALEGELSNLRIFYNLGVRSICLTWSNRNQIADGVNESITGGGLTKFGIEVVEEMNRLGMIIDVSHISEKGFWDVLKYSKKPVIASHSCAKSLCDVSRNLTDEQIKTIANCGGVIGVNFYPKFLSNCGARTLDICNHIKYMIGVGGEDCIGLGSDFDGIEETPSDLTGVWEIRNLIEELELSGLKENTIEKVLGRNFKRVISEIL